MSGKENAKKKKNRISVFKNLKRPFRVETDFLYKFVTLFGRGERERRRVSGGEEKKCKFDLSVLLKF